MKKNMVLFITLFVTFLAVILLSDIFIFHDFEYTAKYILGKIFVSILFGAIAIPIGNAVIKKMKS